jgi:exodeoxyribonuclease VII small subunit
MEPTTIKDFEAAIAELESIVKKLEEGDLALEASLQLYERGVHLSRFCHSRLEEAERRIEILNERGQLKRRRRISTPTTTPRHDRDDRRDGRREYVRARRPSGPRCGRPCCRSPPDCPAPGRSRCATASRRRHADCAACALPGERRAVGGSTADALPAACGSS